MFERYRQPLFLQVKSIRLCAQWHNAIDFTLATCGRSAVGSAEPCQGSGRRFEPGRPLHKKKYLEKVYSYKARSDGREARLGTANPATRVQIPFRPPKIL